ncbi:MAG: shikimate kinase [Erysipelotrichia bacterium]|nr:shikimate kinase [Erysipelotrichia bacterium]
MEYGLIGYPLKHSFSKEIHQLISDYDYSLKELTEAELADFMRKADFKGINVTIPYKQAVIPYLNEIDRQAQMIGAVNTIVNENGKLKGYNTDFFGLLSLLKKINCTIENKNVLILGTGGTSNTAAAVCEYLNAANVDKVSRKNDGQYLTYAQLYQKADKYQIIINATPCGMYPHNSDCAVQTDMFPNLEAVVDVIYNPLNTKLVMQAQKNGIKAIGGLYMLVSQAVHASSLFQSENYSAELIEEIYQKIKKQKQNIVFIGMPTSGKTTIGKIISKQLKREFYDIDDIIVKKNNKEIVDIFHKNGEKVFREYEQQAVKEVYRTNGAVISCGGGTILKEENVQMLKQNGLFIFLDRDLDKLQAGKNRPITSSREQLEEIYQQRYGLYRQYADIVIKNNTTVAAAVEQIEKEL